MGLPFKIHTVEDLLSAVNYALQVYAEEDKWKKLIIQAMSSFRSWE